MENGVAVTSHFLQDEEARHKRKPTWHACKISGPSTHPPTLSSLLTLAYLTRSPSTTQVALELGYKKDTTATAVNYFDRLLSRVTVPAGHLQRAALACISLASKQHERYSLSARDVEHIFVEICNTQQLRLTEQNVLFSLDWDANTVTPLAIADLLLRLVSEPEVAASVRASTEDFFDVAITGA